MWIWMGNAELADPDQIVDVSAISQQAGWAQIHGQLKINAHYELVSDNLMDLSHVQYLHPFLSFDAPPPPDFEVKIGMRQEGEYVYQDNLLLNTPSAPIFKALWGEEKVDIGTMRSHMRWSPPSNLLLDVGMIRPGGSEADGVCIPTAHLLTPETEKSTHYFWAQNRNRHVNDEAFSKQMHAGITDVFINEDEWMIEACQNMMGSTDLLSLKPVLLPGDAAAMRARRVLAARLQEEQIDTHGSSLIGRSSS
jgi:vanillate O-demethylase monooxygenase subunit